MFGGCLLLSNVPCKQLFVAHHILEGFLNSVWAFTSLCLCIYSTLYTLLLLHYCNSEKKFASTIWPSWRQGSYSTFVPPKLCRVPAHGRITTNVCWLNKTINKRLICQAKFISLLRNFYFIKQYKNIRNSLHFHFSTTKATAVEREKQSPHHNILVIKILLCKNT